MSELVNLQSKSVEGNKKTQTGRREEKQFSQTPFTHQPTHKNFHPLIKKSIARTTYRVNSTPQSIIISFFRFFFVHILLWFRTYFTRTRIIYYSIRKFHSNFEEGNGIKKKLARKFSLARNFSFVSWYVFMLQRRSRIGNGFI